MGLLDNLYGVSRGFTVKQVEDRIVVKVKVPEGMLTASLASYPWALT